MKISTPLFLLTNLLLGGSLIPGCSDDDGGTAADCGGVARTICGKFQECAPFGVTSQYGSVGRCELTFKLSCEQATTAPGAKADTSQFASCFEQTYPTCESLLGGRRGLATPESCQPVPGELADGSPCFNDAQCQSTSCSVSGAACGVCQPLRRGKEGEPCGSQECEDLLTCNNKGVCFKPQGAGAPCADDDSECLSPLVCSDKKVCVERKNGQVGAVCEDSTGCEASQGLYCGSEGKCLQLTLAKKGETCGFSATTIIGCEGDATCEENTCVANAPDGGDCSDAQGGKQCTAPATCVGGKCTLPSAPTCN